MHRYSIDFYIPSYFFFFQAEDGIRDLIVTGVQTCALPISRLSEIKAQTIATLTGGEPPRWTADQVEGVVFKLESNIVRQDRKSTRLNSSHDQISYAVFCLKKKKKNKIN